LRRFWKNFGLNVFKQKYLGVCLTKLEIEMSSGKMDWMVLFKFLEEKQTNRTKLRSISKERGPGGGAT
jgi:hypothetical protein